MKRIVLDANILLRAVLGQKVRFLLEEHGGSTQFFTPQLCYGEAQKYLPTLFRKRNLPIEPALEVLERVTCLIQVVDDDLCQSQITTSRLQEPVSKNCDRLLAMSVAP